MPAQNVAFYWEMPAFMLLGLLCGLVGVVMMRVLFVANSVADRIQTTLAIPDSIRPAVAGLFLGLIVCLSSCTMENGRRLRRIFLST